VLIVAALVVGLGVGGWLLWESRDRDDEPQSQLPKSAAGLVRPADMPGLGYLPATTEAIVAIQVPHLVEKLPTDGESDPAEALRQLGVPEGALDVIERASGVGLQNVNQLVVGLDFSQGALPPRTVVVVQSRDRFDLSHIGRKAKASALKRGSRTLTVTPFAPGVELHWWAPSGHVLVATLAQRDYDAIPTEPHIGVGHLRAELSDLIVNRVRDDACAWVAASSDRWDQYLKPYTWFRFTPLQGRSDLIAPAGRLRSVTLAVPAPAESLVDLQLGLNNADAAEELRAALADRFHAEAVEVSGEGEIVRIRTEFDPGRLRSVVGRLVPPRK
jgi:hypothetical protein